MKNISGLLVWAKQNKLMQYEKTTTPLCRSKMFSVCIQIKNKTHKHDARYSLDLKLTIIL